ncbi:FtsX-like permease family protein [Poseidonocella sp. HB161398]|uniref:FtsX-like permease family protein n=1 Tax=Poseidonocella sp. HB161398 TaxID=2320855 RepID=UPI001109619A|nr:FtsX-like permease family protein [Poseidonocella sp. HB161398]
MRDLWDALPVLAQDILVTLGLLAPLALCALVLLRGFAPLPLVRAVLWRFRWANLIFVLLIAVSVGMGIGVIAQERGLRRGMASAADKFDLVISAPGSEMTMMLATVFLQPSDVPLLGGAAYDEIARNENVDIAAPLAFGDSYGTSPVIGTTADFVAHLGDGALEGRMWQSTSEAIAGAAAGLAIGDHFTPAHGTGAGADDHAHDGADYVVTGLLPRSGTPWDRALLIPVEAVWEVHGLANGHAPERAAQIGPPFDPDDFPGTPAVIVKSTALWANYALKSEFTRDAETMAFFPGTVLSELYRVMGDVRQAMSLMSVATQILVAASVLLGLFILTRLFQRQTAMLRALGAPARFVMAVIWSYGAGLLAAGTVLGLGAGYLASAVLSRIVTLRTDVLVEASIGWSEIHLAAAFLAATSLLSLLPALVVLRQPIADGLRA